MADMLADPWLPIGLPIGVTRVGRILQDGPGWQLYASGGGGDRILVAESELAEAWSSRLLIAQDLLLMVAFGGVPRYALLGDSHHMLSGLRFCPSPQNSSDALSFAASLKKTRSVLKEGSLEDGVFVERYSVILPAKGDTRAPNDGVLLGRYLTGGVPVSIDQGRRLAAILSWLPAEKIAAVCAAAGFVSTEQPGPIDTEPFALPGRLQLEAFFREHVLDIVQHPDRYAKLGIDFPGAVVLHGPPGTGKTFAVDRLVEHLGWPRFDVSSQSIGSPYIHDTGRKIGAVFAAATEQAPSVVVIDEMEAFLTDRSSADGSAGYRVEEVAEFLRCIQTASRNRVLVIAMTNRLDTVDAAVLRRGRFDHVIEVGMASEEEIAALLRNLLTSLPHTPDLDVGAIAHRLAGRPLSDVAFALRETSRLTARQGHQAIEMVTLQQVVDDLVATSRPGSGARKIGFAP